MKKFSVIKMTATTTNRIETNKFILAYSHK